MSRGITMPAGPAGDICPEDDSYEQIDHTSMSVCHGARLIRRRGEETVLCAACKRPAKELQPAEEAQP